MQDERQDMAADGAHTGDRTEAQPAVSGTASVGPTVPARRPATSLLTWGTVALVLVIVVVLVVIKLTGTPTAPTSSAPPPPVPASPTIVHAITSIPASVYDAIGITSPDAAVTPPTLLHGQALLSRAGKPEVLFVGNEFCPYCAAERWALVAALSRFGTFSVLDQIQSGSNEAFPSTPTFTFSGAHYASKYIAVDLVEHYSDEKNGAGTAYAILQHLTSQERSLMAKYDRTTPGAPRGVVPFVDVANQAVVAGGSFSPSIFQQLSVADIANGLTDPKDPATQAIVASANYLSAVICRADGQQPSHVCASHGVAAAARGLHLAP